MANKTPETNARPVAETAPSEASNVLVKTTRKQVRIPCGNAFAIVSGISNFRVTRAVADALVAKGDVTIIEG